MLVGTIIGAGIFSLPYAFSLSGSIFSLLGLVSLTVVTLTLNLFYAQIIVGTKGDHQLSGYGEVYLGQKGKIWGIVTILLSSWGAMLAYVILGGDFLAILFGALPNDFFALIYWGLGAFLIWQGIKMVTLIEGWLTGTLVVLALLIPFLGSPFFKKENLTTIPTAPLAFYGPLLFSLSGMGVIPEVEEVLRRSRHLLSRTIVIGVLLPALVYLVFGFGVWAISGLSTTTDALSGLWVWAPNLVRLGAGVGFLSTFTSFLSLGNVIKEVFVRDLKWEEKRAKSAALLSVLPATFLSLKHFLPIISFTGALAIGGGGVLVLIIFLKKFARSFPEKLLAFLVALVLIGGMVSRIMTMIE